MKKKIAVLLSVFLAFFAAADPSLAGWSSGSGGGSGTTNASDLSSGTLPLARITDNTLPITKVIDNTAALIGRFWTGADDYLKRDGTTGTPAGTGDVVGPASATDGYFALFDNTTGKLLKDGFSSVNPSFSTINVTGANALNLGTGSTNAGSARFKNATNNFYFQILGGVSGADIGWTLPTAAPAGNGYWITASTTGVLTYTNGALYATLADPTFTGTPAAPTAAADTDTTQIATTAYVIGQGYAKLVSPSFTTPTLGVATATTLSTGQGQYELYGMDQNVRTTDNVVFNTVTATDGFITSPSTTVAGYLQLSELSGNGTNTITVEAPDAITNTLVLTLPNANPSAQVLRCAAPTDNVSVCTWVTVAPAADPVFTSSLQLPNGADPTVNAAGEIAVDTSATVGAGLRVYAHATYGAVSIPLVQTKCTTIDNAIATSDYPIERFPYAITIRAVHVYQNGGTNIVGQLDECTAEASCTAVDSADITGTDDTNVDDDGTLSNPGIAAGARIWWRTTSVSGENLHAHICFDYTVDAVN